MCKCFNAVGLLAAAGLILSCSGSASGEASLNVEVKAEASITLPAMAELPEKYQLWANASNEFLVLVKDADAKMRGTVVANFASAFGLTATASVSEIAQKIRDAITTKVELRATASVSAEVEASASGEASAGNGSAGASGQANASAAMKAEFKMELVSTTSIDPVVKDNWTKIQAALIELKRVRLVIGNLRGRGDELSAEGNGLIGGIDDDLKGNPTLILKIPQIKTAITSGAGSCSEANSTVKSLQSDIDYLIDVYGEEFTEVQ